MGTDHAVRLAMHTSRVAGGDWGLPDHTFRLAVDTIGVAGGDWGPAARTVWPQTLALIHSTMALWLVVIRSYSYVASNMAPFPSICLSPHSSTEGSKLATMYKVFKLPCILIVDPLTGAQLYSR